jgi:ABC-type multidrug transport system ATPase subunit
MLENLVNTTNLTKRYGEHLAVDSVDLTVRGGEVYGFLGPNGAGKTTTLRMLLGLIRPTAGAARVLGTTPGHPKALARIGMLIEAPAFYPYLSGADNLRVVARYASVPDSRVPEVLRTVHLDKRASDRFGTYSLGMKQRLGVAAALLKDPELLILDEPTNGLDPAGMADMRELIRELGSGERTVVLSSHLMGEVQQVCDRVGIIVNGKLLREGTVAELGGHGALLVRVDQPSLAREVSERLAIDVTVDGDLLRLDTEQDKSAWVNRELVNAGVDVHELRWAERTLEEIFFETTAAGGPDSTRWEEPSDVG